MDALVRRYERIVDDNCSRASNNSDRTPSEDGVQRDGWNDLNLGLEASDSDDFESNSSNIPEIFDRYEEGKDGSDHEFQIQANDQTKDREDKGKSLDGRKNLRSSLEFSQSSPKKSFQNENNSSRSTHWTPTIPSGYSKIGASKDETRITKDSPKRDMSETRSPQSREGVDKINVPNSHFVPHGRASRKCSQHSGKDARSNRTQDVHVEEEKRKVKSPHGPNETSNSGKKSIEALERAPSSMKPNDSRADLQNEVGNVNSCNEESRCLRNNRNQCCENGRSFSSQIDTNKATTKITRRHQFDIKPHDSDRGRLKKDPLRIDTRLSNNNRSNMEEENLNETEDDGACEGNEMGDEGDGGGYASERITRFNCPAYGQRWRDDTCRNGSLNGCRRNLPRDINNHNQQGRQYCRKSSGYHGYASQNRYHNDRGYESEYGARKAPPCGRRRYAPQATELPCVDEYGQELPAPSYGRGRQSTCEDTCFSRKGVFDRHTSYRDDCCVRCPDKYGSCSGRESPLPMKNQPTRLHGEPARDAQGKRNGYRYGNRCGSWPSGKQASRCGDIENRFRSKIGSKCSSRFGSGHSSTHCSRLGSPHGNGDHGTSRREFGIGGYGGSRAGSPIDSDWNCSESLDLSPYSSWSANWAGVPQDKPYPANWRTFGRRPPGINEFRPLGKARLKNVRPAGKQSYLSRVTDEKVAPQCKSDLWDICYGLAKSVRDQWTTPLSYGSEVTRTGDIDPCFFPSRGDLVVINPAQNFYRAMRTGYILTYTGKDYTFGVGDLLVRLGRFNPRTGRYVPYAYLELYMHTESREKRFLGRQPPLSVDFNYYNLDYESPGKYLKIGTFLNERFYPRRGDIIIRGGAWAENFPNVARKFHSCVKYWIPNMEFHPNDMLVRPYVDIGKATRNASFYWGAAELYTYSGKGLGWAYWGRDDHIFDTPFNLENEHGIKTGHYKNEIGHYHCNDDQNAR